MRFILLLQHELPFSIALYATEAGIVARDLFGEENVRFYGGGIPNVFLERGRMTDSAVDDLLIWKN